MLKIKQISYFTNFYANPSVNLMQKQFFLEYVGVGGKNTLYQSTFEDKKNELLYSFLRQSVMALIHKDKKSHQYNQK